MMDELWVAVCALIVWAAMLTEHNPEFEAEWRRHTRTRTSRRR